jgi:hypothetical protein
MSERNGKDVELRLPRACGPGVSLRRTDLGLDRRIGRPFTTVDQVVAVIATHRFKHADELELQEGVAEALAIAGYRVEREVRLSARDRIDLLVDHVGIEVKVGGSAAGVARQLERYACSGEIDALVLASSRRHHLAVPTTLNGKPIVVVSLTAALL